MQLTLNINTSEEGDVSAAIGMLRALLPAEHSDPTATIAGLDPSGLYDGEQLRELLDQSAQASPSEEGGQYNGQDGNGYQPQGQEPSSPPRNTHAASVFAGIYPSVFDEKEEAPGGGGLGAEPATEMGTPVQATPIGAAPTGEQAELDDAGQPWDERIHASTKTKVKDGTWKKKRGVSPALVARVEAEYPADSDYESRAPDPKPVPPPLAVGATAAATGSAPPPPPPPPPVDASDMTYQDLVRMVMSSDGRIKHTDVAAACKAEGVDEMPMLVKQQDKVPAVMKRLRLI